jgi:hypothetical protein
MTIGSKLVQAVNGGRAVSSSHVKNSSGFKKISGITLSKRRLSYRRPCQLGLKGALPIIAEVLFEDADETDVSTANFLHKSENALPLGWPDVLLNPWSLANDETSCKVILSMLKDDKYDQSALLAWLCPALLSLALSDCGSNVVLGVLEVATGSERAMIASQFRCFVNDLCTSPSGHVVLSEFIGMMPVSEIGFVVSELEGKATEVARHEFGYRVIEALLMHGSHVQTSQLAGELVQAAVALSRDPYGHNVLRHLLEYGADAWRMEAIQRMMIETSSLMQQRGLQQCGAEAYYPAYGHPLQASSVLGVA